MIKNEESTEIFYKIQIYYRNLAKFSKNIKMQMIAVTSIIFRIIAFSLTIFIPLSY